MKRGCYRIVFLIGEYVIKIPNFTDGQTIFLKGCTYNIVERYFYKQSKGYPEYKLLVPSLYCSFLGLIRIQKRAEPLNRELSVQELARLECVGSDVNEDNVGLYNGRLVLLDYH